MIIQPKSKIDLTVQSFAYMAKQLARSSAQYEQILSEAEKHRSALRLVQRDVFEMAEQGLRKHALTKTQFHRLRDDTSQTVAQAQKSIANIVAQYAPQKLAA